MIIIIIYLLLHIIWTNVYVSMFWLEPCCGHVEKGQCERALAVRDIALYGMRGRYSGDWMGQKPTQTTATLTIAAIKRECRSCASSIRFTKSTKLLCESTGHLNVCRCAWTSACNAGQLRCFKKVYIFRFSYSVRNFGCAHIATVRLMDRWGTRACLLSRRKSHTFR